MLLVQFLVLAFTGALWWIARRDLSSRAVAILPASSDTSDTQELEQLCATLEALVTDLTRRMERVERQLAQRETSSLSRPSLEMPVYTQEVSPGLKTGPLAASVVPQDSRYAPVYALLEEGVTEPQEIARRTGLGQGEVDLILSLRARRAL